MLLATAAHEVGVATAIDTELGDWQNPNLVYTAGHTMTTLALALGGDEANDVDLLDPLVATGLIIHTPQTRRRAAAIENSPTMMTKRMALLPPRGSPA